MSASGSLDCMERDEVLTCMLASGLEASILSDGALTEISAEGIWALTAFGEGLIEMSASGSLDCSESEGAFTDRLGSGS